MLEVWSPSACLVKSQATWITCGRKYLNFMRALCTFQAYIISFAIKRLVCISSKTPNEAKLTAPIRNWSLVTVRVFSIPWISEKVPRLPSGELTSTTTYLECITSSRFLVQNVAATLCMSMVRGRVLIETENEARGKRNERRKAVGRIVTATMGPVRQSVKPLVSDGCFFPLSFLRLEKAGPEPLCAMTFSGQPIRLPYSHNRLDYRAVSVDCTIVS